MANKKITELNALLSNEVSPASDLIEIVDFSAGVNGSKKITVDNLILGWGITAAGEALAKAASVEAQRTILQFDDLYYDKDIVGGTGGGATKLDGIATVGVTVGRVQILKNSATLNLYRLVAGTDVEDSPSVIRPDDYANGTNQKVWKLCDIRAGLINADVLTSYLGIIAIGDAVIGTDGLTISPTVHIPDVDGILTVRTKVTYITPLTGADINIPRYVDSYIYVNPANNLALLDFITPDLVDMIDGQTITIKCTKNVTTVNINAGSGVTITGDVLTEFVADEVYSFIFIGDIASLDRIK